MSTQVACVQMTSTGDVIQNLAAAKNLIAQAHAKGARLIVLPENFALMGSNESSKLKYQERLHHGPIQSFLSEQAKAYGVWLVGGTIPLSTENPNKVYASCFVHNDQGQCVAQYNKIHLFDVSIQSVNESYLESKTIKAGDEIVVVETPVGKLGLAVCYDLRFPELFRKMVGQGAELVALPSAFTVTTGEAHWEVLIRGRAIENQIFILASAQVGIHDNARQTYGHSMIVNPWGEVQAVLSEKPGIITAKVDLDYLHKIRKEFPVLTHVKL